MLKLLIKLWLIQKRRNFKWRSFFLALYVYAMLGLVVLMTVIESGINLGGEMDRVEWTLVVPVMAAIIMPVDVFGKLLFKHDTALMDAFLKTRPIDNKSWNRFILVSNFFSFWNLCWALPLGIAGFFVMPHLQALLSATLFLMVSMVNGLTVTALRKAQGWSPKLPLIGAWLVWLFVAWGYALNPMGWEWLVHLTIFIVLCIASLAGIMGYMGSLRSYNEQKTHNGDVSGKSLRSLYALEFRAFLRTKRLRKHALLSLGFILQAYIYAQDYPTSHHELAHCIMIPLSIISLSVFYLQFTFAIEGNFFDGLWTKPVAVCDILYRKYYAAMPLTLAGTLSMLPTCIFFGVPLLLILSSTLFGIGLGNLIMLTYCFNTKRIDLFDGGFINTQGSKFSASAFAVAMCTMLLPLVPLYFLEADTIYVIYSVCGIVGLMGHRNAIRWMARRYESRRYAHFERYRE